MKNYLKAGLTTALISLAGAYGSQADTNLVQDVIFQFTAYYQAGTTSNSTSIITDSGKASLKNKDIIALIGLEQGINYTSNAKLIVKRPAGDTNFPVVYVRDKVNGTTTDTAAGDLLSESTHLRIAETKTVLKNGSTTGKTFTQEEWTLSTSQASFDVAGFVNESIITSLYKGDYFTFRSGVLKANGTGMYNASAVYSNAPVVLTGTINVTGRKFEVTQ
jgi:hypothetical protein